MLIRGDKAKEVKRSLYAEGEEGAATLETLAGPLRVVCNYRHLDCRVGCTRSQNVELAVRRCTAQTTIAALRPTLLGDRAIPTRVRTNVARSTVHKRLLRTRLSEAQRGPLRERYTPLRRTLG